MRVRDYVLGTAIGVIPAIIGLVLVGEAASEFLPEVPGWVWLLIGLLVVVQMFRGGRAATVEPGSRIAQLVLVPIVKPAFEVVESEQKTDRGSGGFGHTGVTT